MVLERLGPKNLTAEVEVDKTLVVPPSHDLLLAGKVNADVLRLRVKNEWLINKC